MSLFFNLYEEKAKLLTEKGYNESAIGSPDREGWLLRTLKLKLSDAIQDSFHESGDQEFHLKTVGFFNEDKDMVIYTLNFRFDLQKSDVAIASLELSDGITKTKLSLQKSEDLPLASDWKKLLAQQVIVQRNRNARYVPVHKSIPGRGK